jgi:thioesterase domain-containing protein
VLRASAQALTWGFDDPTLGWRGLARGGVELHRVPGNHASIMNEPIVGQLAERLRACIAGCPEAPPA